MARFKCLLLFLASISLDFLVIFAGPVRDSLSLYPRPTETRQVQSLDGVWNFRLTNRSENGFKSTWFRKSLDQLDYSYERMPVPASFNDITEKREIRDFNGWVWYDRNFFVPSTWTDGAILLRFGSVNYKAIVYVNGQFAMNHTGGHLPFQADVTSLIHLEQQNHISVAVNNVLTNITLPQGKVLFKNDSRKAGQIFSESKPQFDFFNYAGIHRSVWLSYVPMFRIQDVQVKTSTYDDLKTGLVEYRIVGNAPESDNFYWKVALFDRSGNLAAKEVHDSIGTIEVANANLWWPFTMHPNPGYLYTLSVKLFQSSENVGTDRLIDSYYLKIGIRNVSLTSKAFLINGKPFYFRGFGKHEDMAVRGRSMDQSMIQKDYNLMKWIGANSFRTSHYPYSEEMMDEADEQGFVVIDEVPAVGLDPYPQALLDQHLVTIRELIDRDKNRPSVVAWSITNEPVGKPESRPYFSKVSAEARVLDFSKRPITAALANNKIDYIVPFLDFLMINRYYAWYGDFGYLQVIQGNLVQDIRNMYRKYKKLMMFSEYGADTIPGMHAEPSSMFSEDFQSEYLIENHKAFEVLRKDGFLIGEHIWNFADFMTIQGVTRVGGNKKGIFTRDREPKTAARVLRCRYWRLSQDWTNPHRTGVSLCPDVVY